MFLRSSVQSICLLALLAALGLTSSACSAPETNNDQDGDRFALEGENDRDVPSVDGTGPYDQALQVFVNQVSEKMLDEITDTARSFPVPVPIAEALVKNLAHQLLVVEQDRTQEFLDKAIKEYRYCQNNGLDFVSYRGSWRGLKHVVHEAAVNARTDVMDDHAKIDILMREGYSEQNVQQLAVYWSQKFMQAAVGMLLYPFIPKSAEVTPADPVFAGASLDAD